MSGTGEPSWCWGSGAWCPAPAGSPGVECSGREGVHDFILGKAALTPPMTTRPCHSYPVHPPNCLTIKGMLTTYKSIRPVCNTFCVYCMTKNCHTSLYILCSDGRVMRQSIPDGVWQRDLTCSEFLPYLVTKSFIHGRLVAEVRCCGRRAGGPRGRRRSPSPSTVMLTRQPPEAVPLL